MKLGRRDLEYFAVVAQHGNLGRAADALGLSQPALSMSLRRLEEVAGGKLVRRTPKGVDLTDVGHVLLKRVERLRLAHQDVMRELNDLGSGRAGHLRVGTSLGVSNVRLAAACSILVREAPRVRIDIVGGDGAVLLPRLRSGDLHFALTTARGPCDDLVSETAWVDEFVVYCSMRHRLARRRALHVSDLAGECGVVAPQTGGASEAGLRALGEHGVPEPQIIIECTDVEARLRIIAATDLLGINARATVQDASKRLSIKALRVRGLPLATRTSAIMYRKDAYLSPAAKRLIDLIKAAANQAGSSVAATVAQDGLGRSESFV